VTAEHDERKPWDEPWDREVVLDAEDGRLRKVTLTFPEDHDDPFLVVAWPSGQYEALVPAFIAGSREELAQLLESDDAQEVREICARKDGNGLSQ
jgi:hypothetical protein